MAHQLRVLALSTCVQFSAPIQWFTNIHNPRSRKSDTSNVHQDGMGCAFIYAGKTLRRKIKSILKLKKYLLLEESSFSVCVPQFLSILSSSSSFKALIIGGVSEASLFFLINKLAGDPSGEESFSGGEWYLKQ